MKGPSRTQKAHYHGFYNARPVTTRAAYKSELVGILGTVSKIFNHLALDNNIQISTQKIASPIHYSHVRGHQDNKKQSKNLAISRYTQHRDGQIG